MHNSKSHYQNLQNPRSESANLFLIAESAFHIAYISIAGANWTICGYLDTRSWGSKYFETDHCLYWEVFIGNW